METLIRKKQDLKFQSGRYRQPVEIPQNRGHVVMWSCGHVVMWSCGHVVMWSCGQIDELPHIKVGLIQPACTLRFPQIYK